MYVYWVAFFLVAAGQQQEVKTAPRELLVTSGKSLVVDSPVNVERVSIANAETAEALAVTPREVLINGKKPGETTLIVWQQGGQRLIFELVVRPNLARVERIQALIREEIKDP